MQTNSYFQKYKSYQFCLINFKKNFFIINTIFTEYFNEHYINN